MTDPASGLSAAGQSAGDKSDVHVLIPAGLDLEQYLEADLRCYADCARYLLHTIHMGRCRKGADKGGYVPLMADLLRPYFPGDRRVFTRIKGCLIAGGVIECDGRYIPGEKSYGYKLGKEYIGMRHRRFPVTYPKLVGEILAFRRGQEEQAEAAGAVYRHLRHYLRGLEIDRDAATEALLNEPGFKPEQETAVQLIHDRQFFISVDDYGRVHTNLTNLKSSMRHFLSWRGESLANLDVRNSQPLFFAAVLREHFGSFEAMPPDARHYVGLVQAGQLYNHLMAEWGIPADRRQNFKRHFFGRVFYRTPYYVPNEAIRFAAMFPNVCAVIRESKADDYASLSRMLQRRESGIIIGGVATRCMKELPHVPLWTIHDSVVTIPGRAAAVKDIMLQEFAKVGLEPTINVEPLSPEHYARPGSRPKRLRKRKRSKHTPHHTTATHTHNTHHL